MSLQDKYIFVGTAGFIFVFLLDYRQHPFEPVQRIENYFFFLFACLLHQTFSAVGVAGVHAIDLHPGAVF